MLTIIAFIFVFNVIVFVHEFGHFYVARKNGIRVEEFALGMGPALFKKEKNGTLYAFRVIPLGGYCKMYGEDEKNDSPEAFNSKKPWQRFLVVLAGPFMNFVFTIIIFAVLAMSFGSPTLTIDKVVDGMPAKIAGVQPGDKVIRINGEKSYLWEQVIKDISTSDGDITLEVEREGEIKSFRLSTDESKKIGIQIAVSKNPFTAIKYSFNKSWFLTSEIGDFLKKLVTGRALGEGVVGPVGLAGIIGDVAQTGFVNLLHLMAYISLNLGLMNLLPIPALDGGRLVFIIVEMIRRKPIPEEKEGMVHTIGFVLLLLLFAFVMYKDIVRMFFS